MIYKKTLFSSLVLYSVIFNLVNGDQDSPSVIIVGAGASGIAAASKLLQNGFKNITILEAEDRIGGRVYTTQFGGYLVDMGGQWVHGEVGNIAFELAWPLGLIERADRKIQNTVLYDSSGTLIDHTMSNDIFNFYVATKENMSVNTEKADGPTSTGEYYQNEFAKYFEAHPTWNKSAKGVLHMFDMLEMSGDSGDTWWDVSTTSEFRESPGDNLINWKERGYGTILDILMKRYPNPEEELPVVNNTILNTEVSLINSNENGKVSVTTAKGETYLADHVIVTPSLGVLKEQYSTLFQPSLSEERIKTIKGLGYGNVAKIYFSYEEPWWPSDLTAAGFNFLWKDEEITQLENDPEKSWLLGLVGFWFVEHKPRLLYGWVSGNYSREMEKLTEQQVLNHSIEALQRFVGKHYNVTMPTEMKRTTWYSNKHFRGTYSFRSLKSDADDAWHRKLSEPIGDKKPVVLFAGEATNANYFSTVHGAIGSGWREADRLIEFYPDLEKDKV